MCDDKKSLNENVRLVLIRLATSSLECLEWDYQ